MAVTGQQKGEPQMPKLDRPIPPYVQIANHYRDRILSGELAPGAKLPSLADLATEWDVAPNTAAKAIGQLQVEGAIYTSPRGSFVADKDVVATTPAQRAGARGTRRTRPETESVRVTAAESVVAPNYVAELLSLDAGTLVIRREEITYSRAVPVMLSVDWVPASDVMEAAELLAQEPVAGGLLRAIHRATGRTVSHGEDHLRGRASDAREADALRIPVGSPILAGVHVWSDNDGVLVYGEWVLPSDHVIRYDYEPDATAAT